MEGGGQGRGERSGGWSLEKTEKCVRYVHTAHEGRSFKFCAAVKAAVIKTERKS